MDITKWVDDGYPVDVIYLDFQKAFDKVPHERLILNLKSYCMGNGMVVSDGEVSNCYLDLNLECGATRVLLRPVLF